MTDTGTVPGEGRPEDAGMVEQPGTPAAEYAYLGPSETPQEDDDLLLMPSAQGAWSDPQPVPSQPAPSVEHDAGYRPPAQHAAPPVQQARSAADGHPLGEPAPLIDQPAPVTEPAAQPAADASAPAEAQAHHGLTQQHTPAHGVVSGDPAAAGPGEQAPAADGLTYAADGQGYALDAQARPSDGQGFAPNGPGYAPDGRAPGSDGQGHAYGGNPAYAQEAAAQAVEPTARPAGESAAGEPPAGRVPSPASAPDSSIGGPVPAAAGSAPNASRRPLHFGPPVSDPPSGIVRSLADRGPAAARTAPAYPVRSQTPGPPTTGPEYLDIPRDDPSAGAVDGPGAGAGAEEPQGGVPWVPQPQPGQPEQGVPDGSEQIAGDGAAPAPATSLDDPSAQGPQDVRDVQEPQDVQDVQDMREAQDGPAVPPAQDTGVAHGADGAALPGAPAHEPSEAVAPE
ncbi:hypothetical protein L1885_22110, partial [Streptomyces fuscigenes]|nr:hypothetical protein [Streptomyces fuscigenes]